MESYYRWHQMYNIWYVKKLKGLTFVLRIEYVIISAIKLLGFIIWNMSKFKNVILHNTSKVK